jgi:hypothetical protein
MPSRLLAATIFAAAVFVSADAIAAPFGQPPTSIPQAPIGHLQPRARPYSPDSGAEQIEQDRMSTFNAEQHKLDLELDRSLNICRC